MAAFVLAVVIGLFTVLLHRRLIRAPRWRRRWVAWLGDLILGVGAACMLAMFGVGVGLIGPQRLRPFAWLGGVWMGMCLYLLLGILVLAVAALWMRIAGQPGENRRDLHRMGVPVVVAASLVITGLGVHWARHPEVTHRTVTIKNLPSQFDGLTIALLTDAHVGPTRGAQFARQLTTQINATHPDLVIVGGDLIDGPPAAYAPEIAPFRDLTAPLGVYAITGNHEVYTRDVPDWVNAWQKLGMHVLQNESALISRDGARLNLVGVNDISGKGSEGPNPARAFAQAVPDAPSIFLAHQPRQAQSAQGRGVALQLSGHTHGGQLWPGRYVVPLQQPVVDGAHHVGDILVLTSRGAGTWGPPMRVGAPAEIPLITLRTAR